MQIAEKKYNFEQMLNEIKVIINSRVASIYNTYKFQFATLSIDKDDLYQEVAIMVDRMSIDEELVRLDSHLAQFNEILDESGAMGRKLDFLVQEINREINTIASKSNDLEINQIVIDAKSDIEKLREQIQNVE